MIVKVEIIGIGNFHRHIVSKYENLSVYEEAMINSHGYCKEYGAYSIIDTEWKTPSIIIHHLIISKPYTEFLENYEIELRSKKLKRILK